MSFHLPLELIGMDGFSAGFQGGAVGKPGILACYLALKPNVGAKGKSQ